MKKAVLALADGTVFEGRALGYEGETVGEVVFNTAMTGYQEVLTDPSYRGQIVAMKRPSLVPPVVDSSVFTPHSASIAAATASVSVPGVTTRTTRRIV